MRILHYLGVWHIFIAVLILCAHQPFIALCHETGTSSSSPEASGKPKTSQGTGPAGSQSDQTKVPAGGNKKDVNIDFDSDEDTEENSDEPNKKDISGGNQDEQSTKDSEDEPIVSTSGSTVSSQQDDTMSQDSSGTSSSPELSQEDDSQQQTQSSHHQDGLEADSKGQTGQDEGQGVEDVVSSGGSLGGDGDKQAESAGDSHKHGRGNHAAVQQLGTTNNPSLIPEIINILPEPIPVPPPATEKQTGDEKFEETKPESREHAPKIVEAKIEDPKDERVDEQGVPKVNDGLDASDKEEQKLPEGKEDDTKTPTTAETQEPSVDKSEGEGQEPPEGEEQHGDKEIKDGEASKEGEEVEKPGKGEGKEGEDDTKPPVKDEMPSFDEWKEKMLQEEEQKKREQGQASKSPASPPVRPKFSLTENSKNHASSDCGAKLLSTNKEAQSATAILNINPDLYMLNPCTANIKFLVELCEPIQVKQIEIANYELFSSVPESFRVSISDRYPAREWHLLGTFHARNERVLQSFPLHDEQMFAKYMKFEMLTFFGSEHYCPISVLRVFGTNVVEEIEDADSVDDVINNPPEFLPPHPTPLPGDENRKNGLLESAKDVVIGLVQRAAKVLAGREDPDWKEEDLPCLPADAPSNSSINKTSELHASDPAQLPYEEHLEICMPSIYKQCVGVDIDFSSMRQLCRGQSCCFCPNYAERFEYCRQRSRSPDASNEYRCCKDASLCSMDKGALKQKETVKMEPPLKLTENKENLDSSKESKEENIIDTKLSPDEVAKPIDKAEEPKLKPQIKTSVETAATKKPDVVQPKENDLLPKDQKPILTAAPKLEKMPVSVVINISSLREIEPTKTLPPPVVDRTASARDSSSDTVAQVVVETKSQTHKLEPTADANQGIPVQAAEKTPNLNKADTEIDSHAEEEEKTLSGETEPGGKAGDKIEDKAPKVHVETPPKAETSPKGDSASSTTKSGGDGVLNTSGTSGINSGGIFIGQQKESVFMRLNNRIKDLELNMSLSSRYLEELSQRYKKQMEEMQKAFNVTITKLTENAKTAHNRDTEQQEYIDKLETQLAEIGSLLQNTTQRLDNVLREVIERHLFLMFIEIFVMSLLFLFCIGRRPAKIYIPVENGLPHTLKSPVQNHVGHPIPVAAKAPSVDHNSAGRTMHASPRRRNRSLGECTPVKASATNTGGGSCDELLIIGHTTPFLEALQQAESPDGASKRKGRHKSRHKIASKSSSTTAVPLTNGHHHEGHHRAHETSQAGLLFRGSAHKDDSSLESNGYALPNGAIKRLFSSSSIDRIEDLSHGGTTAKQKKVEHTKQVSHPGHVKQPLHKSKQPKSDASTIKNSTPAALKQSSASASNLPHVGHQKPHGKLADKKSRSSPALQQVNTHQSGPGRLPNKPKKTSPYMNGKR